MNRPNDEKWQQDQNAADNDPYFKDSPNDNSQNNYQGNYQSNYQNNYQNQSTRDDPFAASDVYGQYYQNQQYQGYQPPHDPYAQYYDQSTPKRSSFYESVPASRQGVSARSAFSIIFKALLFVLLFFVIQNAVVIIAEIPVALDLTAQGITDENVLNEKIYEHIAKYGNYLSALSGFITILTVFIIFVCKRQNPFKELSFNKTKISTIVLCLVVGFTLNFSCNVLFMFMPESWLENYTQASEALDDGSLFSYILGGVIMAPLVEEIIFRGILAKRFGKCMPSIFAAILSAVVFGVCHGDLVWAIYAGSLGIILGVIFARFDSIIPCICVHFAFNGVSAILQVVYEIPAIKNMTEAQELIFNGAYTIFSFAMVAVSIALITLIMTSQKLLVKSPEKEFAASNE